MKNKIMKFKLNRQVIKLQKHMKKQEKQINVILDKLEQMEPKGKEIVIKK